jgi:hypothetical protein
MTDTDAMQTHVEYYYYLIRGAYSTRTTTQHSRLKYSKADPRDHMAIQAHTSNSFGNGSMDIRIGVVGLLIPAKAGRVTPATMTHTSCTFSPFFFPGLH